MKDWRKLFEELSEKAESVIITVADKGNEVFDKTAEAVSDKIELAELESELVQLYVEAGRQVYEKYTKSNKTNYKSFKVIFDDIERVSCDIAAVEENIKRRKGIRICGECGEEIDREVSYCPHCGAEQPEDDDFDNDFDDDGKDTYECAYCGADVDPTDKFCHNCGNRV